MKNIWVLRGLKFAVAAASAIAALGYIVMSLFNLLLPQLTGWHAISYGQAVGLLGLCRILFGGCLRGHGGWHWRHRIRERWEQMTPAGREWFRAGAGRHCHHSPPATDGAPTRRTSAFGDGGITCIEPSTTTCKR